MLSIRSTLFLASLGLVAANANAQRETRCWYDDAGKYHCSDNFTPEDARHDRTILNSQGIRVGEEEGEVTAEEQAAIDRALQEEAARLLAEAESQRYDEILLRTYLNVEDIEDLRDRRLELMDSQIRVTEIYLRNLESKLEDLERSARRFAPYSDREDASPIPENLARDIDQTESSISMRENALKEIQANQQRIRVDFGRDIDRFRQLKGQRAD